MPLNFIILLPLILGVITATLWTSLPAQAQQDSQRSSKTAQSVRDANAGTVRILTTGVGSAHLVQEIAKTLNKTGSLRVLPVLGDGGVQNINDVLYLRGIDMALVREDMLNLLRSQRTYGQIEKRIRYIAKLFDEEIHLVTRRNITDMSQLSGLQVNFGDPGSGTFERADRIFKAFGISVVPVSYDTQKAIELVASGEIAATLHVGAKPSPVIRQIDSSANLRLLPIPATADMSLSYGASTLQKEDYPNLIADGQSLETVSVGSILIVYRWNKPNERSIKVDNFVRTFFSQIEQIQQPYRHPKWQDIALLSDVAGWRRLKIASNLASTQIARKRAEDQLVISAAARPLRKQFERFLDTINREQAAPPPVQEEKTDGSGEQLENLLTDFLRWRQEQTQ